MASFKVRNGALQVAIRKKGYRPVYQTFDDTKEGWIAAEQWAEDIELSMKRGRYTDADNSKDTPLRDALQRYLREVVPTMKSKTPHASRVRLLCSMPLTDRAMGDLSGMLVAQGRDELLAQGYSGSSIRIMMGILSRVYTLAATEWGIAVTNPLSNVRRPKENKGRTRRLAPEEEAQLLDALNSPFREMVVFLLETAMRRGELYRLNWKDIFLNDAYLILRDTKNGEERSIPLSKRAISVLKSLPRHINGLVFEGHPDSLTHAFSDACKSLGIEDLRIHDLRHEATSRLFEKGVFDVMEVASITGHKDLRMLKRYTHLSASNLAKKLG